MTGHRQNNPHHPHATKTDAGIGKAEHRQAAAFKTSATPIAGSRMSTKAGSAQPEERIAHPRAPNREGADTLALSRIAAPVTQPP
jgi:hypothetical protein